MGVIHTSLCTKAKHYAICLCIISFHFFFFFALYWKKKIEMRMAYGNYQVNWPCGCSAIVTRWYSCFLNSYWVNFVPSDTVTLLHIISVNSSCSFFFSHGRLDAIFYWQRLMIMQVLLNDRCFAYIINICQLLVVKII